MSTTINRQTFWRAPSGRIHSMKRCSSAAPVNRMRAVRLTRAEFEALADDISLRRDAEQDHRCRCASWSDRLAAAGTVAREGKDGDPFAGFPQDGGR